MKRIRVKIRDVIKYALVDDEDYMRLSRFSWCLNIRKHTSYAFRSTRINGKPRLYQMHREVMGIHETNYRDQSLQVDHINKNGLDNRKKNLRLCTQSQNLGNSKVQSNNKSCQIKGIYRTKETRNNWFATIQVNKVRHYLGSFKSKKEAAKAYNEAAKKYAGEFARPNKFRVEG